MFSQNYTYNILYKRVQNALQKAQSLIIKKLQQTVLLTITAKKYA